MFEKLIYCNTSRKSADNDNQYGHRAWTLSIQEKVLSFLAWEKLPSFWAWEDVQKEDTIKVYKTIYAMERMVVWNIFSPSQNIKTRDHLRKLIGRRFRTDKRKLFIQNMETITVCHGL